MNHFSKQETLTLCASSASTAIRPLIWQIPYMPTRIRSGSHLLRCQTLGGPPVDIELPCDPRDRPSVAFVKYVDHSPILLTLYPSLLSGAGVANRTLAGGTCRS